MSERSKEAKRKCFELLQRALEISIAYCRIMSDFASWYVKHYLCVRTPFIMYRFYVGGTARSRITSYSSINFQLVHWKIIPVKKSAIRKNKNKSNYGRYKQPSSVTENNL